MVCMSQPDAEPKKGIIHCRAVALTSVMSKRYARCVVLRLEKEKELEGWKQLYLGGVDGLRLEQIPGNCGNILEILDILETCFMHFSRIFFRVFVFSFSAFCGSYFSFSFFSVVFLLSFLFLPPVRS